MALASDRNTPFRDLTHVQHPVAAGANIFIGALIALDPTTGFVAPATAATGLRAMGRAENSADNRNGGDGALNVTCRRDVLQYRNDAGDAVDRLDIGTPCFMLDDETVSATDGGGVRSAAGTVIDVDARGVWVDLR